MGPRTSSPRSALARVLVAPTLGVLALPVLAGVGRPALAATASLRLESAPLSVGPDQPIDILLRSEPSGGVPTEVDIEARRIDTSSTDLTSALASTSAPTVDTVSITGGAIGVDNGVVHVKVPTENHRDSAESLRLDEPGLYALRLSVPGTATVITLPIFRIDTVKPTGLLPVSVLLSVDTLPTVSPDGSLEIDDAARAAVAAASSVLAGSTVPMALSVRPELVDALAQSPVAGDAQLVPELASAIGRQRLLAVPYLHIDPSVAADSNLIDAFTAQLRSGEDALSNSLQRLPDRRVWVATDPLSPHGAALVRNLGAVVFVQAAGAVNDPVVAGTGPEAITEQPVLVPTPLDRSDLAGGDDPVTAAHVIAAKLLLTYKDIVDPKVVLVPDLATADAATLRAFVALLGTGDLVQGVDVEQLGVGHPAPATPGSGVVADFSKAAATRAMLMKTVRTTAEVLPDGDNRPTIWSTQADLLLDTRLTDTLRSRYEDQLEAAVKAVQDDIVLQAPSAVNLGDRSTSIPITIRNDNTVPVTVRVRLAGAKLRTDTVSDPVTIDPGKTAFVRLKVASRSNGRFPVVATLLSPKTSGTLGRSVRVSVRVGRLAGLGLVITFGFGLVILTWWGQHLRRRWRREETAELERLGVPTTTDDE